MSSLCSLDPRKSFGVADELESFFHVLLHEALMSSNHNLSPDRTQAFVRDYFHRHSSWSGGAFCSAEKEYAIKCATLRYGAINIMFGGHIQHPMNRLLHELLPLFQARMKIHTWEVNDMARRMPPAKVSLPSPSPSPPNSAKPPTIMDMRRYQAIQLGTLAKPPMHAPIASTSENPDDDTYNKAARLDDHACFRSLIATALQREWSPPRVYPQSDAHGVHMRFSGALTAVRNVTRYPRSSGTFQDEFGR